MRLTIATLVLIWASCGGNCPPQTTAPPAMPMTDADNDESRVYVDAAEQLAEATCACKSTACADGHANDLAQWLRAHPDRSGSGVTAKRALIAMEKMLVCRDALLHPDEPLDLDAPDAPAKNARTNARTEPEKDG